MRAFFFAPEDPRRLALVRIGTGAVLLYDALLHWSCAVELYSTSGPALPVFTDPALHGPVPGPWTAVLLQTLLIFSLACVTAGWQTRCSLWLAFVLAAWLGPLDRAATFAKYSVLGLHLLALLGVSGCGAAWSVDARRRRSTASGDPPVEAFCPLSSAWPRRLIQILLCSMYLGAALTKFRSQSFAQGDLLMFSLLDDHWGSGRIGHWLATLPQVPLLLSLATVLFEMVFPFLVWGRASRWPMLIIAFVFHGSMCLLLSVGIFCPLMMVVLLAFLEPQDFARADGWIRRLRLAIRGVRDQRPGAATEWTSHAPSACAAEPPQARRPSRALRSAVLYLLIGAAFTGGGGLLQWLRDADHVFGRKAVEKLAPISEDQVNVMLAGQLPAFEDYFHRIELGSRYSGNAVFGGRGGYRTGQQVYVLAQLIVPHPRLRLEGVLIAPDGREAARFAHTVEPAFGYAINGFELTEILPAGPYRILLRADGYEIAERRFELRP